MDKNLDKENNFSRGRGYSLIFSLFQKGKYKIEYQHLVP
jgi:hypothetical protein